MEDAGVKILAISDLLYQSRPLSATSALRSSPRRPVPPPPTRRKPDRRDEFSHQNPEHSPRVLSPLSYPAMLVGTVTLPGQDDEGDSTSPKCSNLGTCFRFTDGTSRICCDVLDFSFYMLGEKIHVVSFNFIPFESGGGFLEIIKWSFPQSDAAFRPCSNRSSFPLGSVSCSSSEECSKARYFVRGAVESISPVFIVPCSTGTSSGTVSTRNLRGFIVLLVTCECKLCSSKDSPMVLAWDSLESSESHTYVKPVFVYFCGSASSWHPAIVKLVGNVVVLLGLKKKLIFMGKDESELMFVTTDKSLLHLLKMPSKMSTARRTSIIRGSECIGYTGLVTGIYMQGMVIELDKEFWLLVTDQQLHLPHSLRVGAVISLKNTHFLSRKYFWPEMLVLGGCFRTSMVIESFSPSETRYFQLASNHCKNDHIPHSTKKGLLSRVLLTASCFHEKFSGILSEKEILGSINKEGFLQIFACSHLPISAFETRHGVFTEMCKHALCGFGSHFKETELKLAVPLSLLVRHCEATWTRFLRDFRRACDVSLHNDECNGLNGQLIRRIIPSDDIGIILLGHLKVSPSSGRLQLVDSTSSLDVLVPDLPSSWDTSSIYEVSDYSVIMEGIHRQTGQFGTSDLQSLSCRSIFNPISLVREMGLDILICFHLRNAICRNSLPSRDNSNEYEEPSSSRFHILQIMHKYPVLQKFSSNHIISETAFVEATVLPWNLFIAGENGPEHLPYATMGQLEEALENHTCKSMDVPYKRCKTEAKPSMNLVAGSTDNGSDSGTDKGAFSYHQTCHGNSRYCNMNHLEVPCLATLRGVNNCVLVRPGSLRRIKVDRSFGTEYKESPSEVWLEFKSSDFFKYQMLNIGGFYAVKHSKEEQLCHFEGSGCASGMKFRFTSETKFWSLSFSARDGLFNESSHDSPFRNNKVILEDEIGDFTQIFSGHFSEAFPDISLYVSGGAADPFQMGLVDVEHGLKNPTVCPKEVSVPSDGGDKISLFLSAEFSSFDYFFPDGDLISICGDVIAIRRFNFSSIYLHRSHGCLLTSSQTLRNSLEARSSVSIHVLVGNHIVQIFGSLRKHAYSTGFGPGVNATFYRILRVSGHEGYLLTPVSFIMTNSIRVINKQCRTEDTRMLGSLDRSFACNFIPSGLISELIEGSGCTTIQLRCKVVAVHILILEKTNIQLDCLQSTFCSPSPPVNIPVAGFIVEDGSSLSFCWATGEQASTLLRLDEKLPQSALENTNWTIKWVETRNSAFRTSRYHVERILKQHAKITVRNCISMLDSSQEFVFSVGSDNVLSKSEEDLLTHILFHASFATDWKIIGTAMDMNAIRQVEKQYLPEMEKEMELIQQMWAKEVSHLNPRDEAKKVIEELLSSN